MYCYASNVYIHQRNQNEHKYISLSLSVALTPSSLSDISFVRSVSPAYRNLCVRNTCTPAAFYSTFSCVVLSQKFGLRCSHGTHAQPGFIAQIPMQRLDVFDVMLSNTCARLSASFTMAAHNFDNCASIKIEVVLIYENFRLNCE